jgi:hypothetical protein
VHLTRNELKGLFGLGQHCKLAGEWDKFVIIMLVIPSQHLKQKQRVCHTAALPFTLKSTLRRKKNNENSNIFTFLKYSIQKIL